MTSLPLNVSLSSPRSNTTRPHWNTGNTKHFKQICFVCNETRPCDSKAYNEGELGVCEFKRVQKNGWWMLWMQLKKQVQSITCRKRKDKDMMKILKKLKSYEEVLNNSMNKKLTWTSYTEAMQTFWVSCYKISCILFNTILVTFDDKIEWRSMSLDMHSLILPVLLAKYGYWKMIGTPY